MIQSAFCWVKLLPLDATDPGRPFWEMTLSYGEHVVKAQLVWCEETLKKLKAGEK